MIPLGTAETGTRLARLVIMTTVFAMTESELIAGSRDPGTLDFVVCVGLLYVILSSSQRIVPAFSKRLSVLCVVCDVIFVTALVDLTGGVTSELYPLYYLPILQACIRLRPRDAISAALLSVAFYSFLGYATGFATELSVTVGVRVATFGASAIFMAVFFALMMRETREKQQHVNRIERLLERMNILFEMGRLLSATLDFSTLMKRTANCAVRAVGAKAAGVLLVDPETGRAMPAAVDRAGRQNAALPALEATWALGQMAADSGKAITIPGRRGERELARRSPPRLRKTVKSALSVPFGREDKPLGVLQVVNARSGDAFAAEDIDLLASIGAQAAVAVENARLFGELQERIEDLESAQKELAQAEKLSALGRLISGVAHELNNPLTAVLGFAELLMQKPSIGKAQSRIRLIHEAAVRCKRIVEDLLVFARNSEPTRTSVDINETVRRALSMQEDNLGAAEVEVSLELDKSLPPVMADGAQIEQVVVNLVRNAQQAMSRQPAPRELRIATRQHDGCVQIEISDNGHGIAPADMKRIFDPFFTTQQTGQGTGLGLSVSYGIVQAHGGSIRASSVVPHGARFVVDLPLGADAAAEHSAETEQHEESPPLCAYVLIADDDDAVRGLLREALLEAGAEVDEAAHGKDAWHKACTRYYDAIILDIKMPVMDGPALYEKLRRRDESVAQRVIFITGDTLSADTAAFLDSVDTPRFAKPFVLQDLVAAVRAVITPTTAL